MVNGGLKHEKILKCLLAVGMTLVTGMSASAMVSGIRDKDTNWDVIYPIVTTQNQSAQNIINQDIQGYFSRMRYAFKQGKYYSCTGNYAVNYEDSDVLSISLLLSRYPYGGNGNHLNSYDIVYDKHTGRRIPLYNYVKVSTEDLQRYKYAHAYDGRGNPLRGNVGDIKSIPDNYILLGGGVVVLVFQPYELTSGVFGRTFIVLDSQYVNYLNRKNQW